MTENLILTFHVLIALAIIGLILLQQGKGAEAGASFGAGASQTIFGSAGSWNFFSKMTAVLATLFFITSFGLAIMAKDRAMVADGPTPGLVVEKPQAESEVPLVDEAADVTEEEVPVVEEGKVDKPQEEKK